jgi:hypothetical protein
VTSIPEAGESDELLRLAAAGDGVSREALAGGSRHRLRRMVASRLDPRLREEAAGLRYLRAVQRLKEILQSLGGDWLEL